ncbi:MAG: hypothetical protein JEZ06_20080 [Anaerolineaceae bacterium]|nr:hypothetical protein [Anaerolineaceae bacterium]
MKKFLILIILLPLTACNIVLSSPNESVSDAVPDQQTTQAHMVSTLLDLGEAPELLNEIWLNTDTALRLRDLRGKVVLLEMWTFG